MMTNHDERSSKREEEGQDTCDREGGSETPGNDLHRGVDLGNLFVELADVLVEILDGLLPVCHLSRLGPCREAANEFGEPIFELDEPLLHVSRVCFDTFRLL